MIVRRIPDDEVAPAMVARPEGSLALCWHPSATMSNGKTVGRMRLLATNPNSDSRESIPVAFAGLSVLSVGLVAATHHSREIIG